MAADISKRLDRAEKALIKGRAADASAELEALLREHPDDEGLTEAAVEMLLLHGERAQAGEILGRRFDRLVRLRRLAQAQTTFERLQQVQRQPGSRFLALAALLEQARQPRPAESAYRQAAALFRAAEQPAQELLAWRNILRLNPKDYSTCLEVAARAEAAGEAEFAGQLYASAAEISHGDPRLLAKALHLLPERADLRLAYARALLAQGQGQGTAALEVLAPLRPQVANDEAVAAAFTDAWLETASPEEQVTAAREAITERLGASTDTAWLQRGWRCLRLLARSGAPGTALFAATLERHANTEDPAWRIALDGALADGHEHGLLLYLAAAFERAGQPAKVISALYQSFDLALADGHYDTAAERLDKILAVDAHESSAQDKLDLLHGHIPEPRWAELHTQLAEPPRAESDLLEEVGEAEAEIAVGASLEDLVLQAEIFLQYQMAAQARERARIIARLYPGEEAVSERLAKLYEATGIRVVPSSGDRATPPSGAAGTASTPTAAPAAAVLAGIDASAVVRAVHREATPRRLFLAAVNQLGRAWMADRCLVAQFHPGQPPSNVVEYCAPGAAASDAAFVARLLTLVEAQLTAGGGSVRLPRTNEGAQIAQTLRKMGIETLVAHPLEEAGQVTGVLLLEFCRAERAWPSSDAQTLAGLADQIVLALANVRLRGLLRQMTELDERTGMLRISSLLELLVAECVRAQEQKSPLAVMCIELLRPPGGPAPDLGSPEMRSWQERVAQRITAYLRPNDAGASLPGRDAIRYVFVLPETVSVNCAAVFHKLRGVVGDFTWPQGGPVTLAGGAAEVVAEPELAAEDAATDLLDRALRAMELHRAAPETPIRVLAQAGGPG
ncbi:MAG: GAF domain-containing protein [Terriglobales bacterium]